MANNHCHILKKAPCTESIDIVYNYLWHLPSLGLSQYI